MNKYFVKFVTGRNINEFRTMWLPGVFVVGEITRTREGNVEIQKVL